MITCAQIDSKQAYLVKIRDVWLCFSYNTLVCIVHGLNFYETKEYHSKTTTNHIKKFAYTYSNRHGNYSKVDNIDFLANQLLFESTRDMVVSQITE